MDSRALSPWHRSFAYTVRGHWLAFGIFGRTYSCVSSRSLHLLSPHPICPLFSSVHVVLSLFSPLLSLVFFILSPCLSGLSSRRVQYLLHQAQAPCPPPPSCIHFCYTVPLYHSHTSSFSRCAYIGIAHTLRSGSNIQWLEHTLQILYSAQYIFTIFSLVLSRGVLSG
ncbi:hypothetical protein DENSPDRAFT_186506 [Dentipellis sp. KUC8613]|nr:hypothetical protein DENSPDRAFT_186506 [Dentipellis sp. KUC8613]